MKGGPWKQDVTISISVINEENYESCFIWHEPFLLMLSNIFNIEYAFNISLLWCDNSVGQKYMCKSHLG